ncbi:OmpA family protein [Marivita geojedonensis]|uniref:OmpA family protein n=1 Tax=Marivita geojedonensis TaxID=1123756 RepID=UPI000A1EF4DF|nr:OmpA family protein [Marivita geojedonensis]PRY80010.1 OOP family OmpA-OmpF porin [Marivita geojedonensis]
MSITRRRAEFFGLCLAGCLAAGPAAALELALPSGARETVSRETPAGAYDLPIAAWSSETGVPVASLDGEVLRKAWRMSGAGITTGQVLGRLREQLLENGFDIIFECAARSCGGFDFRFGIEVLRAPNMYVDLSDYRFLSAKSSDATQALSLLVSRDGDTVFVQLIEVGPPGRPAVTVSQAPSVSVPADAGDVIARLEQVGHVVLADLEFASGSASLGDGPVQSLDAVVSYLTENPTRRITFVGHTDATGSLEANVALSRRRAEAAMSYVTSRGVASSQVAADGVGFLSPRATNLTAEGREANRRVEAVLISVE